MTTVSGSPWYDLATSAGLFSLTFVSEDAASLTGATLSAFGALDWKLAFAACFLGIWLGDLGLYFAARGFGRPIVARFEGRRPALSARISRSEMWFARHGLATLAISRFIPGARLPAFLTAGLLRMPVLRFATTTAILAALWLAFLFLLARLFPNLVQTPWLMAPAVVLAGLFLSRPLWWPALGRLGNHPAIRRWRQWEFWPAWLFYLPVGAHYLRLAARYRGLSVPAAANPGMTTGGLIGESKFATLRLLQEAHPHLVAKSFLLSPGGDRIAGLDKGLRKLGLDYPIVLKPDVGQRGSGFRVVRDRAQAVRLLDASPTALVAQEYVPGPEELGIFYYRLPSEESGRILAITEKIFPTIVGDGVSTVEELIRADERAAIIAGTYLRRFSQIRSKKLAPGETLRLVEAGNHAQGCIFRDGMRFRTPALEARIDEISRSVPGFFVGRYDIRFASFEALSRGEDFKILELNGAASEATNAYDARHSLREAYAILFRQWEIVFAIGAENRARGHRPEGPSEILLQWRRYQRMSRCHLAAD